jgi:hypothetical protein
MEHDVFGAAADCKGKYYDDKGRVSEYIHSPHLICLSFVDYSSAQKWAWRNFQESARTIFCETAFG